MKEETNKQILQRLREKGRALGIGKPAQADKLSRKMAEQAKPTGTQVFNANKNTFILNADMHRNSKCKPIRCLDTGQEWASLAECAKFLGVNSTSITNAFVKSQETPRVAKIRKLRFIYIAEADAAAKMESWPYVNVAG